MCRLTQLVERRPRRRPTSTLDPSAVAQPSRRTDRGHHVAAQAGSRAARRGGAQPERHAEEGARWRSCPRATPRVTRLCVPADSLQSARRAPAHTPAALPVAAVAAGGKACCTPVPQPKAVPVRVIRGVRSLQMHPGGRCRCSRECRPPRCSRTWARSWPRRAWAPSCPRVSSCAARRCRAVTAACRISAVGKRREGGGPRRGMDLQALEVAKAAQVGGPCAAARDCSPCDAPMSAGKEKSELKRVFSQVVFNTTLRTMIHQSKASDGV